MSIKQKIQSDFVIAMKAKDEIAKSALSGIKAKITEAEKANGNQELQDSEIIKILNKAIKQREESQKIYEDAGREEMSKKEADEACILRAYMPSQMSEEEIESSINEILARIGEEPNRNKRIGQAMGAFNKQFQGRADVSKVKQIIEKLA